MKNKVNNKQNNIKVSLLCVATLVVGLAVGLVINRPKTIPVLKDGQEVLATVDGKEFTANDLYAELKSQGGYQVLTSLIDNYISSTEITDDTDAQTYAESYLENLKLQYKQAGVSLEDDLKAYGYESEEAFVKIVKEDYLRNLAAEKYIKENMISESEINKYWKENIFGSMHVRYILIQPEHTDSMTDEQVQEEEAKALATANEVIEKLKNGEDFADLATKYSDDSSTASQGGLFDGFTKDEVVPEFWNAASKLADGKYTTSPVESSYGYFVIYRISQDEKPSVDDSKDQILDALLLEKKQTEDTIIEDAWKKLRKQYNLEIIDSDINALYKKNN